MLTFWSRMRRRDKPRMPLLKKLFWLYFLLLLLEGALRKWVVPQLSAPLLLIRDPVGLWIMWEAYRSHKWPRNWSSTIAILTLGLVGLCAFQMIFDSNPWYVAVYGLRSYLLPFPVAFIMGENLDEEDLRKFALFSLFFMLPLTAIEVLQYVSPPSAWINAGAYLGAGQIGYAGDHVRASGTFSYDVGPADLVPLAAAFILYGLVNEKFAKRWLIWASAFAAILSIPMIGARAVVYELVGVLGTVLIAAMFGVSQLAKSLKIIFPVLFVYLLVSFLPVFSDATATLNSRFIQGHASEGNTQHIFLLRVFEPVIDAVENADFSRNWIGVGMGRGAAAVSVLERGTVSFVAGEGANGREVIEMGPYPGLAYMLFCFGLGFLILVKALGRAQQHEPLALLLVPAMLSTLCMGIYEQPTEQGFMVVCVAFSLAAIKMHSAPVRSIAAVGSQRAELAAARLRRQELFSRRPAAGSDPSPNL
jgi:hypothetical protein